MVAEEMIAQITIKYPSAAVDKYVIMPDHIHLLLVFDQKNGDGKAGKWDGKPVPYIGKYNRLVQISGDKAGQQEKEYPRRETLSAVLLARFVYIGTRECVPMLVLPPSSRRQADVHRTSAFE